MLYITITLGSIGYHLICQLPQSIFAVSQHKVHIQAMIKPWTEREQQLQWIFLSEHGLESSLKHLLPRGWCHLSSSVQGDGVNSIFVMNKSLSVSALRLETKNSTDSFFPFSPSPIPTLMRSMLAFAGAVEHRRRCWFVSWQPLHGQNSLEQQGLGSRLKSGILNVGS